MTLIAIILQDLSSYQFHMYSSLTYFHDSTQSRTLNNLPMDSILLLIQRLHHIQLFVQLVLYELHHWKCMIQHRMETLWPSWVLLASNWLSCWVHLKIGLLLLPEVLQWVLRTHMHKKAGFSEDFRYSRSVSVKNTLHHSGPLPALLCALMQSS